jgi:hypothetical protein
MSSNTHITADLASKRIREALVARIGEALADERLDRQNRGDVYLSSNS